MKVTNITTIAGLLLLFLASTIFAQSDLPSLATCLVLQVQDPLAYLNFCTNRGKGVDYQWFKEQQRRQDEEAKRLSDEAIRQFEAGRQEMRRQAERHELEMRLQQLENELWNLKNR